MSQLAPGREPALPALGAGSRIAGASYAAAAVAIGAAVALRIVLLFRHHIDSDETQHLHVVWGWAHGLVPYRDFFDNHMPLFHVLAVPLLWLGGERPETLLLARLAMLPLFAAMLLLAYRIGSALYPRRIVIAGLVLGSFAPAFFLCSIEFRADDLWAAAWLLSVATLVRGSLTPRRAAWAGLALGVAGAVSAKTSLLAVSLAAAAVGTLVATREERVPLRHVAKCGAAFAAAAAVPVAAVAAYFFSRGAWESFLYCTVAHNVVAHEHPHRVLFAPISLLLVVRGARHILRDAATPAVRRRRVFLFLTASLYGATLISFWPIIEREHWLPFYPIAAIAAAPFLMPRDKSALPWLALAILTFDVIWIMRAGTPWADHTARAMTTIRQATALTAPGERVIDLKGEIVFRRRALYYVLEKLTKKAISRGRLRDTIAEDVVRTGTMVAVPDSPSFPVQGREFLRRNFVRVGCVRVAGMIVTPGQPFRVEVPGQYAAVAEHGELRGTLDGISYAAPRFLTPGLHTLDASPSSGRVAVIWERAAAHGFSPFGASCVDDGFAHR